MKSCSTATRTPWCSKSNKWAGLHAIRGGIAAFSCVCRTTCGSRPNLCSKTRKTFMDDQILSRVAAAIEARKSALPDTSYVADLLSKGENAILKKIGEEATETVMA